MPQGENFRGKKPENAGRKKGTKPKKVVERELLEAEAKAIYKQQLINRLSKLSLTQYAKAVGSYKVYLVEHYTEKTTGQVKKRHVLVEDDQLIADILDNPKMDMGDNYVIIEKQESDTRVLIDALDRVVGKPTTTISGDKDNPLQIIINRNF